MRDAKTGNVVRRFEEPEVGNVLPALLFPQFTANGRFLLFVCPQPDDKGHKTMLPRIYDTKTWTRHDVLPDFPANVLTCIEAAKGKRAVVLLKGGVMVLWDCEHHREYARLDKDVQIRQVAFSPDESMVAIATLRDRGDGEWPKWTSWGFRIRVWKIATGEVAHELYPFEQTTCEAVMGLQWTADGKYILAATKLSGSDYDVNIWNAGTGRHRGNLIEGLDPSWAVTIVPDKTRVAACGTTYTLNNKYESKGKEAIRFWDLAAALKQIRAFEDSFVEPKAVK